MHPGYQPQPFNGGRNAAEYSGELSAVFTQRDTAKGEPRWGEKGWADVAVAGDILVALDIATRSVVQGPIPRRFLAQQL